jgi:hypothetical protein
MSAHVPVLISIPPKYTVAEANWPPVQITPANSMSVEQAFLHDRPKRRPLLSCTSLIVALAAI